MSVGQVAIGVGAGLATGIPVGMGINAITRASRKDDPNSSFALMPALSTMAVGVGMAMIGGIMLSAGSGSRWAPALAGGGFGVALGSLAGVAVGAKAVGVEIARP